MGVKTDRATTRARVEARLERLIPKMTADELLDYLRVLDRRDEKHTGDATPVVFTLTTGEVSVGGGEAIPLVLPGKSSGKGTSKKSRKKR